MINQKMTLQNEAGAQTREPPEWLSRFRRYFKAWRDVGRREEIALQKDMNRAMIDPNIRPRDKILLRMRTEAEGDCRSRQYASSAYTPCSIDFPSGRPAYHACPGAVLGCLNTITALYIFDHRQQFPYVRARDLETWLWRKWFQPYITDIELNRSFVKIFAVEYKTLYIRLGSLISLHCGVCEQSERYKDVLCPKKGRHSRPSISGPLRAFPWGDPHVNENADKYLQHIYIQPLFRALFMVFVYPEEQTPGPKDIGWVSRAQVQLILTGIMEG